MNVRKTISSWGGVNQDDVYLVGHSLGTVNGVSFLSATDDSGDDTLKIAGTHLLTPASGLVRMLENSPSFAPTILGGLAQPAPLGAGLMQGDANLETYFNVLQAAIDSTDPINFADNLVVNSSVVLLSQIEGDRTTIAAAYEGLGTGQPWELPFSVTLGNFPINSSQAPLAGSLPLANELGIKETAFFTGYDDGSHGTPVSPIEDKTEAPDLNAFEFDFLKDRTLSAGGDVITTEAEAQATFTGMIQTTLGVIYPQP
jgi:pimeloyl-ACP methyl ester carboxylesterase